VSVCACASVLAQGERGEGKNINLSYRRHPWCLQRFSALSVRPLLLNKTQQYDTCLLQVGTYSISLLNLVGKVRSGDFVYANKFFNFLGVPWISVGTGGG
jgi:hypothetical protein